MVGGGAPSNVPTESPEARSWREAFFECKYAATKTLKDPSSAEWQPDFTTRRIGTGVAITGIVRAKNSFGAVVPEQITCAMQREGRGWRVLSVYSQ